ncbi:hypothetical protein [Streptomyces fradiae]|uniref:hypothetical protein n=1 Tax=Streptomyces fradiae TaxID=1906 RepID=UPI0036544AFE
MRKTTAAVSLVVAAGLLTGCGGGAAESPGGGAAGTPGASPTAGMPEGSGEGRAKGGDTSYEVTIEVGGTGSTMVMYSLDDSGTETVTLPWKKTATITPVGAEKEVGRLVIVTPGSVSDGNGMLTAASCTITVNGEKVADNGNGKIPKPCSYKLK